MECYETWKFSLGKKTKRKSARFAPSKGHWFSPGSLSLIVENLHIGHLEREQETKTRTQVWLLFLVSWRGKCSSRNEPVGLVFKRRNSKDYYSEIDRIYSFFLSIIEGNQGRKKLEKQKEKKLSPWCILRCLSTPMNVDSIIFLFESKKRTDDPHRKPSAAACRSERA